MFFPRRKNLGVTLIAMLDYEDCIENGHLIENNYFGPRPVYGSNGAETIRVGTSQQCHRNSRTVIRNNVFGKCNGEVEVVSIKSGENIIENNVYRGGNDESTAGPYVYLRNCRFDDCCNKVRGAAVRIIGAQVLEITGCEFVNSGKAGVAVRLDEAPWEDITLRNLKFVNSGGVRSNGDFGY